MNKIIEAKARTDKTKASLNRMRRSGNVPAILYNQEGGSESLELDGKTVGALFRSIKKGYLPTTKILLTRTDEGKDVEAIVKGIDYNAITQNIIHMDFMPVKKGEKVNVLVPIRYEGADVCPGIQSGGVLTSVMRHVRVRVDADKIPTEAVGDVSMLQLKQSIRVKNLTGLETVDRLLTNSNNSTAKITKR